MLTFDLMNLSRFDLAKIVYSLIMCNYEKLALETIVKAYPELTLNECAKMFDDYKHYRIAIA